MNRRDFLKAASAAFASATLSSSARAAGPQLAVTMDDFNVLDGVSLSAVERSARILAAFKQHGAQAMGLVVGRNAATAQGNRVLDEWASAGHSIGNHTYSHPDYHATSTSAEAFARDFRRADATLRTRRGFTPFFRFPMLRGGDTAEKRDSMRAVLAQFDYREAHVTIDNADWLIDRALRDRLSADPKADARPYRDLYLRHMLAYTRYFREAAAEVFERDIPHTLLTHFNLLSALYLGDLLDALRGEGWSIIPAFEAYGDAVFRRAPQVLPAGDSLVVACARESKRRLPRAPLEDERWLTTELERLRR